MARKALFQLVFALAKYFASENGNDEEEPLPKVIMLSSAGVTRPSWDKEKKAEFAGCADIPIVRLNPFGILDIKADSEERLRKSGKFFIRKRKRLLFRKSNQIDCLIIIYIERYTVRYL